MNARYGAEFLGQLAEKLRQLCTAGDIALVDAICRWYDDEDLNRDRDGYAAAGFRIASVPARAAAASRSRS